MDLEEGCQPITLIVPTDPVHADKAMPQLDVAHATNLAAGRLVERIFQSCESRSSTCGWGIVQVQRQQVFEEPGSQLDVDRSALSGAESSRDRGGGETEEKTTTLSCLDRRWISQTDM